jgi:tetratricopeptide (TPR) repeat protein
MTLSRQSFDRLLQAARSAEGDLLERYELRHELGRGGMGVVHEAYDRELDRVVAIKLLAGVAGLSADLRARFLREARAAARLSHPNIAAVHDATADAIVMQKVEGTTLDRHPARDPRTLAALVRDAALALHYAHIQGVVHRDVKPANLMVEPGPPPRVVVTDFGLAKETAIDTALSSSGSVLGTPQFMAPEQARAAPADARSDVYSLGASLYACLAGRAPFEASDVVTLLRAVADEEPRPLGREVPRDLATIVRKAMAKEPARRYPSALAFASDLERWLSGLPVEARPPSVTYLVRRALSRRRGVVLGAFLAASLALIVFLPAWHAARARERLAEEALALSDFVAATLQNVRTYRDIGLDRDADESLSRAIERCESFLTQRAEIGRVYDFLARLREQTGDRAGAAAAFDRALELDPALATVRVDRGVLSALRHGDHVARQDLEAVELDELRDAALADLAVLEEAGAGLTAAEVLFARAMRSYLSGERAQAERELLDVVGLDDLHIDALLTLSRLYVAEHRDEEAMRYSVKAADLMRCHRATYRAQRHVGAPTGAAPDVPFRLLVGLDELTHDFAAARIAYPSATFGLAARGSDGLRDAAFEFGRGERAEALRILEIAAREFDGALGSEERAELWIDRGVCHALRARVLDAAGRHGDARLAVRAAEEDYARAAALAPGHPALATAQGVLALRAANIAALEGRAEEARAHVEAATLALERAAAALGPDSVERRHVDTLRSR